MNARVLAVLACLLLGGCAAQRAPSAPAAFDHAACDQTCIEMWQACNASCLRVNDPTGRIAGSGEGCERICRGKRQTCEIACIQEREPTP